MEGLQSDLDETVAEFDDEDFEAAFRDLDDPAAGPVEE